MNPPRDDPHRLLIERYAERAALFQVRGASFTHCLRLNHLAPECALVDEKGNTITLRGQDLVHQKTWATFLAQAEVNLSWLSYGVGTIATTYAQWLRSSHTKRYQVPMTNAEHTWFMQATRLAVLWHLLQQKYETHAFLDPWAESEMGKLLLLREYCREMARAVHHGQKEPEQAALLLEQAYEHALSLIADRTFPPYEPIPGLPPGIADPLALPEEERRDE